MLPASLRLLRLARCWHHAHRALAAPRRPLHTSACPRTSSGSKHERHIHSAQAMELSNSDDVITNDTDIGADTPQPSRAPSQHPSFLAAKFDARPESFDSLLAFISKHRHKDASERAEQLRTRLTALSRNHFNSLQRSHGEFVIEAAVAARMWHLALRILRKLWPAPVTRPLTPSPPPLRCQRILTALESFTDAGKSNRATVDQLLEYCDSHYYQLSPSQIVSVMQCYANYYRWSDILSLGHRCQAQSLPLSLYSLKLMMDAYQRIGDWQAAVALLEQSVSMPHIAHSSKLSSLYHSCMLALGAAGQSQRALDMFTMMKTQGVPVSGATFAAIINALSNDPGSASIFTYAHLFALYEEMTLMETPMTLPLYLALCRGCLHFNQPRFAMSFFEEMIEWAVKHDRRDGAWKLVGNFANDRRIWEMLVTIGVAMKEPAVIPNIFERLCDAYSIVQRTLTAKQKLESQSREFIGLHHFDELLTYLYDHQRYDLIREIWSPAVNKIRLKPKPSSYYYRILAETLTVNDSDRESVSVSDSVTDSDGDSDSDSLTSLLSKAFVLMNRNLIYNATTGVVEANWSPIRDAKSLQQSLALYLVLTKYSGLIQSTVMAMVNSENGGDVSAIDRETLLHCPTLADSLAITMHPSMMPAFQSHLLSDYGVTVTATSYNCRAMLPAAVLKQLQRRFEMQLTIRARQVRTERAASP